MAEQELISTASKFISSLVKSLQIICNGHVDFNESIELIGHINVRVDHKFKYDCIVDEHVSKEGEDCSTTFLSNSYHSSPPARETFVQDRLQTEQDLSITALPASSHKTQQSQPTGARAILTESKKSEESGHMYGVNADSSKVQNSQENQMVFKLEGDDSNECMLLSTADGNYEPLGDVNDAKGNTSSSSWSAEDSVGGSRTRKRRKMSDQDPEDEKETKVDVTSNLGLWHMPLTSSLQVIPPSKSNSFLSNRNPRYDSATNKTSSSKFPNRTNLNLNEQSAPGTCFQEVTSLVCKFCNNVWNSLKDYREHMCRVHKYVTCQQCSKLCPTNGALRGHMNREHTPKLVCSICSKTFHCKLNYSGHMNMHYGNKPYACRNCGKLFAYQQSKYAHEKLCTLSLSPS